MLEQIFTNKVKGPKPEHATTIYHVKWHLRSDSFDNFGVRASSSSTPIRLQKHKTFISKDKAETLYKELLTAFASLEYGLEGVVYIEEDYYE